MTTQRDVVHPASRSICSFRSRTRSRSSWSSRRSRSARPSRSGRRTAEDHLRPARGEADLLPVVPRIFEKIYTLAHSNAEDPEALAQAVKLGRELRDRQERGEPVPPDMQQAFDAADEKLFVNVRNLFGGSDPSVRDGRRADRAGDPRVLLRLRRPDHGGLRMTETSTVATVNTVEEHRFGSVGKPIPGISVKIAEDGEVLISGRTSSRPTTRTTRPRTRP